MAEEARYVYSVAKTAIKENLGEIGIEKREVFTIPYKDIAAVVHSCLPQAYDTKDRARAEEWVLEHSYVIDQAMKRFGSVLPFSFDVILKGDDSAIAMWLDKNYKILRENIENVQGKAEYTIQIYYDYDDLAGKILEDRRRIEWHEEPHREREQRNGLSAAEKIGSKAKEPGVPKSRQSG